MTDSEASGLKKMEPNSDTLSTRKDIYSSLRVDGTSSMLYNSAYVNEYDLPSTSVTEESNTVTISEPMDNVTSNPAYGNINPQKTDTAGYNHLFGLEKPQPQIYGHLMWKKQDKYRTLSCTATAVSSVALIASIVALLATIIVPLSVNMEASQQAALAVQTNNCTTINSLLTNCTISQQQLQKLEARLNASLEEIFQFNETVAELTMMQSALQASIDTLTERLGVTGTPTQQATTVLPSSASTIVQPGTEAPTIDSRLDQLDSSISRLEADQNQLQLDQSALQDDVETLIAQINTPVNLYNRCYEQTQECYRNAATGLYWRQCATGELPMNIAVRNYIIIVYTSLCTVCKQTLY